MPNPETTILDESAVSEIEARAGDKWTVNTDTIRALCATVRALRKERDDALSLLENSIAIELRNTDLQSQLEQLQLDLNSTRESYRELEEEYSKRVTEIEQLRAENEQCRRALRKFVNWYAVDSTEEKRDSAFEAAQEALADERLYTEAEFKAAYPDRAFTWDLDEHPEDGSGDICACRSCRELSYED